jgi:hypothetical protein
MLELWPTSGVPSARRARLAVWSGAEKLPRQISWIADPHHRQNVALTKLCHDKKYSLPYGSEFLAFPNLSAHLRAIGVSFVSTAIYKVKGA